jgi:protein TonB
MAVKGEFGSERRSSEGKDWPPALQDPANAKSRKPEDIDDLVSSFLAELTDLSSGIGPDAALETKVKPQPVAQDARMPAGLNLQEAIQSGPELDLEGIDAEIEKALSELEGLVPEAVLLKRDSAPQARLKPTEPSPGAGIETPARQAESPPVYMEIKTVTKPDIFQSSVSAANSVWRRHLGIWIAAGVILVAVVAVWAIYLQRVENVPVPARKTVSNLPVGQSHAAPERTQSAPAVAEKSLDSNRSKASAGPFEPVKSPVPEQTKPKPVAKSAVLKEATGNSKPSGSAVAESRIRRTAEPNGNGSSPEKTHANEAPARPAPAQEAAVAPPPQKPEPAITPPAAAPQPRSAAAAPAENAAGGNDSIAPVAASVREPPPAAPKPAPSVNTEPADTPVQPKTGTLLPPVILTRFQPEYPALARAQKVDGTVDVEVDVNEKGDAVRVKAVSGPILLRAAAESAVGKSKFRPALLDGVSTAGKTRISVSFKIR